VLSGYRLQGGNAAWPASGAQPRLALLGAFELQVGGVSVVVGHGSERVLAFIALQGGAVRRSRLAGSLWLDADDERAAASLRSALWRLRQRGCDVIEVIDDRVALRRDVALDVRDIGILASAVLEGAHVCTREQIDALALAGDLLPGWYEEWVLVEGESLRDMRLRALERSCLVLTESGRYDDAALAGLAAVAIEPLRESAHRALVALHLAEGNAAEALRQYRLFAQLLRSRLDLAPSPLMEELVSELNRRRERFASARRGS
jgi:DNA-binding SARP family transcriptional activator